MNRKAMSIGMVFVFLIAVITFAVIMIFGYKAITEFMGRGETVEYFQFKNDLESSVKKIYTEYGSVRIERFNVPFRYERICFVDLDKDYESVFTSDKPCTFDILACDTWKDSAGWATADQNVFLYPLPPEGSAPIKTYKIEVEGGFLCLDLTGGSFEIRMEGKGDRTLIEKPKEDVQ